MKTSHYSQKPANAGAAAPGVPFYEFVQPTLYVGEAVSALLWAGITASTRALAAARRWHRERVTRQTLQGLDDRTLADIGVVRSEIPGVARMAAEYPTFNASRRSGWRA